MIPVLYISTIHKFKVIAFFEVITTGHLRLLPLRSASALNMWALVGLIKLSDANKIMRLSFFLITIGHRGYSEISLYIFLQGNYNATHNFNPGPHI